MQNKVLLTNDIILEHFGETVLKVANTLIRRGYLPLTEIINETQLTYTQVRNSLLTLIQHNLCVFFNQQQLHERIVSAEKRRQQEEENILLGVQKKGGDEGAEDDRDEVEKEGRIFYQMQMENVLLRLKFSKFIAQSRIEFGELGELLTEEVIEHGRVSFEDAIKKSAAKLLQRIVVDINDDPAPEIAQLKETFSDMVQRRFFKRVEEKDTVKKAQLQRTGIVAVAVAGDSGRLSSTASMSSSSASLAAALKGSGPVRSKAKATTTPKKRGKKAASDDEPQTPKSRAKKKADGEDEASTNAKKRKRRVVDDEDGDTDQSKPTSDLILDEEISEYDLIMQSGPPSKKKAVAVESNTLEDSDLNDVLWTLNYDQYIRTFRNDAFVDYIGKKVNPTAGSVMRAMLQLTSHMERTRHDDVSSMVSLDSIHAELQSDDADISRQMVHNYLKIFARDGLEYTQPMGNSGGGSYVINLSRLCTIIRQQYAESIIEQKFGAVGSRIVRILLEKKYLEQKQIADIAMIPIKDARTLLCKMLQQGILQLQDVPRSADHHPTRTFYLFNVDMEKIFSLLTEEMYKTCYNLRSRLRREQQLAIERIGPVANVTALSVAQQQQLEKLQKAEDRLESSIIHLNEMLVFFEDLRTPQTAAVN